MKARLNNASLTSTILVWLGNPSLTKGPRLSLDWLVIMGVPVVLFCLVVWDIPALVPIPICGFRNLTGLPCPGCGITRGLSALLRGDPVQAIQFNPLTIPTLGGFILLWFNSCNHLAGRRSILSRFNDLVQGTDHRRWWWGVLFGVGVFWAWRVGLCLMDNGVEAMLREGWLYQWFELARR